MPDKDIPYNPRTAAVIMEYKTSFLRQNQEIPKWDNSLGVGANWERTCDFEIEWGYYRAKVLLQEIARLDEENNELRKLLKGRLPDKADGLERYFAELDALVLKAFPEHGPHGVSKTIAYLDPKP